jgi:addiction module HigA family antidote
MSKQKEENKYLQPIHPGDILKTEFMEPLAISSNYLARLLSVPPNRVLEIVNRKRGISIETAYKLARCFGTSVEMWLNLQQRYELRKARYEHMTEKWDKEVRLLETA